MNNKFNAILFLMTLMTLGCTKSSHFELKPLPETSEFNTQGEFGFSISPSDEFLVYSKDPHYEKQDYEQNYAIAVFNLLDGSKKIIPVSAETNMAFTSNYKECWSQDSNYCVINSPLGNNYGGVYPKFIIDTSDINNIKLINQSSNFPSPNPYMTYSEIEPSDKFTCSDCLSATGLKYLEHANAERMLEKDLLQKNQVLGNQYRYRNVYFWMTDDQKYMFYVKYDGRNKASLIKLDLNSYNQEELTEFSKSSWCINVGELRLSPNGNLLAFKVSYGCTFVTPSDLYVIDIEQKEKYLVSKNVYSGAVWNSKSDKLYFYRCKEASNCQPEDSIYYAIIDKES